jgi:polysaccharide chain length determinant protein (PEP-CTERM system associated)
LAKPNSSQNEQTIKESVIAVLREGIKFRQKPPRFLVMSYRGTRSEVNAKILNTLVSALIEEKTRAELTMAGQNYEFVKAELENYRKKLEEAEAELKEFKEEHIAELPTDMNVNLTQLTSDKSELMACELEMKELTSRVQYLDQELQKQNELIISEVRREANPMLTVLNQRIVDMEIELTRLRTNYTELHPRVAELKGQLEDLKRQRDEAEKETLDTETSQLNPVYQQLTQDKQNTLVRMEVLKNRIANLQKRIGQNEEKVRSMPEQEQQLATLTRNYEVTSNIYNMFLQKLEEVRLQEKLANEEKSTESFKVLEFARATFTPVAPERMKVMMVIALAGACTCFGIMALLNHFDDSFKNVEDAKQFIGKPLLGTVPSLDGSGNGHFRIPGPLRNKVENKSD